MDRGVCISSPWGHKESDMTENTHICKTKDMVRSRWGTAGWAAGGKGAHASVDFCRGFLIKA